MVARDVYSLAARPVPLWGAQKGIRYAVCHGALAPPLNRYFLSAPRPLLAHFGGSDTNAHGHRFLLHKGSIHSGLFLFYFFLLHYPITSII